MKTEGDLICSQKYNSMITQRLFADDAESIEYVNGTLDNVSAEVKNGKIIVKDSSNQSGRGTIYTFMHGMNGAEYYVELDCDFTDGEAQANISDCISGSGEYLFKYFIVKNFDYPEKPLKYKHIRRISD